MMRLLDIWMSVPDMLLAIIVAAALGASFTHTVLAVGVVTIPRYARVMRAQDVYKRQPPLRPPRRHADASRRQPPRATRAYPVQREGTGPKHADSADGNGTPPAGPRGSEWCRLSPAASPGADHRR